MIGDFGHIGFEDVPIKGGQAFVEYNAYLDVLRILAFVPLQKIADGYRITGDEKKANLIQDLVNEIKERHHDLGFIPSRDDHANYRPE